MAINGKWNGGDQNGMEMELWSMAENGNCPFPFCPEHWRRRHWLNTDEMRAPTYIIYMYILQVIL